MKYETITIDSKSVGAWSLKLGIDNEIKKMVAQGWQLFTVSNSSDVIILIFWKED